MTFTRSIQCQDALGRPGATDIRLADHDHRVTVAVPTPAGSYDWRQLDSLIAALQAARGLLPGGTR